ncbi:MAG: helix-turn-helix domain-containing protein, partial [Paracoccaceae bacterium]
FIGRRIRQFRWTCGITQAELAQNLGVEPPQIDAYERGTTRIAAVQLFQIAEMMDVPVTVFYDGMAALQDATGETAGVRGPSRSLSTRQSQMLTHFNNLPGRQQEAILNMAKAMAEQLCRSVTSLRDSSSPVVGQGQRGMG